jgi:hypothetical protein
MIDRSLGVFFLKIILTAAGIVFPISAFAYLDPGTGSIILQGLIAGLAVAAVVMRTYWYKIKGFFGRSESKSLSDEEDFDSDEESDSKS